MERMKTQTPMLQQEDLLARNGLAAGELEVVRRRGLHLQAREPAKLAAREAAIKRRTPRAKAATC